MRARRHLPRRRVVHRRPYSEREQPETPGDRPPYQGATPISDIWSAKALEYGGRYLREAVAGDDEARGWMMLAASLAGIGFGAAGVHIPHACAYPIAGLKHEHRPPGYPTDHGFIPHGQSVIVTAPAAFRFTYEAAPERHHHAAELLAGHPLADAGQETLPELLLDLMGDVGVPMGLRELGYGIEDVDALVEGAHEAAAPARRRAAQGGAGGPRRDPTSVALGARSSRPRRPRGRCARSSRACSP